MPYRFNGLGDDSAPDDLTTELANLDQQIQDQFGPNASLSFLEPLNTGDIAGAGGFGPIGSPVGCAAGFVVADASGNCVSASSAQGQTAAASFSAPGSVSSLLSSIFGPGSSLPSIIGASKTNPNAVTINPNLLLYGGLALGVIVLLSFARGK